MLHVSRDRDNLSYNSSEIKMALTQRLGKVWQKGNSHMLSGCGNGFHHHPEELAVSSQGAPFTGGLRQDGRNEDDPNTHRRQED